MGRGRPAPEVVLTVSERSALERAASASKGEQAKVLRARIVLACAEGKTNTQIAGEIGIARETAGKWRRRFLRSRLDGLSDEPRPGAPRRIRPEDVQRVLELTAASPPPGGGRWSTRTMARASGLSQTAVSRIWRACALVPRSSPELALSRDPLFIQRISAIGGMYLDPAACALVLIADEAGKARGEVPLPHYARRNRRQKTGYDRARLSGLLDRMREQLASQSAEGPRLPDPRFRGFTNAVAPLARPDKEVFLVLWQRSSARQNGSARNGEPSAVDAARNGLRVRIAPTLESWLEFTERWLIALAECDLKGNGPRTTEALEEHLQQHLEGRRSGGTFPFEWLRVVGPRPTEAPVTYVAVPHAPSSATRLRALGSLPMLAVR